MTLGIKCPHCGSARGQLVTDSRPMVENGIRRRRKCMACKKTFATVELPVMGTALDMRDFNRAVKLLAAMKAAGI